MIYIIVVTAVVTTIVTAYLVDRLSNLRNNIDALNNYAMASFDRIVRIEAIIDQYIEIEGLEDDDDET